MLSQQQEQEQKEKILCCCEPSHTHEERPDHSPPYKHPVSPFKRLCLDMDCIRVTWKATNRELCWLSWPSTWMVLHNSPGSWLSFLFPRRNSCTLWMQKISHSSILPKIQKDWISFIWYFIFEFLPKKCLPSIELLGHQFISPENNPPRLAKCCAPPAWGVRSDGTQQRNSSGWWLNQPIWKICSSKWVHLP